MAQSSYMIPPGQSQADIDLRRKLALALQQQSVQPQQIDHWTQGLAQLANAGISGLELRNIDKSEREETSKGDAILMKYAAALQGGAGAPSSGGSPASAIAGIESGGRYDALGPETKGDRAYGKYQVMGANIPQWTKAHLGQEMTPEQFLANPQAQDAVFKGQFGQYSQKYGPEGAARAWFAGEGGMNNPNAKDVLGTTVSQYGQKFAQALGQPAGAPAPAGGAADRNAMLVEMLGNRKTRPMAQQLISAQIGQQFKPQEYDYKPRDDGSIVAINKKNPRDTQIIQPGSSADLIKFAADKEAATTTAKLKAERAVTQPERDRQQRQTADIVTQDIDRTLAKVTTMPVRTTGAGGQILSGVPGTEAHNVSKLLDTVKANAGFDKLNAMRQASPTGGALGNVTERELALLQSTIGNLEQSQDDKQLADNLRRVKNAYLDVIHGPGNGPAREKMTFQEKQGAAPSRADIEAEMRRRGLLK